MHTRTPAIRQLKFKGGIPISQNGQAAPLTDSELQENIAALTRKSKGFLIPAIVLVILCIPLALIANAGGEGSDGFAALMSTAVAAFIGGFILLLCFFKVKGKIKVFVSENVTRGLLCEVFEVEQYNPTGQIDCSQIQGSGLVDGWQQCGGSDYVRGRYMGHNIEFSDIHLERVYKAKDSDGNYTKEKQTIFKGQWIILEHDKDLSAPLIVREKAFFPPLISRTPSDIETENDGFNKRFQLLTTDGHTAFLILTPHFMEFITTADAKANGNTLMSFYGNRISIAIDNDSDSFEVSAKQLKDIEGLRQAQRADIKYLTNIIDELMQNDFLFHQ